MGEIRVTPQMMSSIAKEVDSKITEWNEAVNTIYRLHAEMDAMWDGQANDAFNQLFQEDHEKFKTLSSTMEEYSIAIKKAADKYMEDEQRIKEIVSRRG